MKAHSWKSYAFWILFTEAVGALSGWLTPDGAGLYAETPVKPPLSPPALVFPIVWGIPFVLLGVGAPRGCRQPPPRGKGGEKKRIASGKFEGEKGKGRKKKGDKSVACW